ncbi:hypothetical protein [Ruminococcus sp.]|uniref:hypothetical protein n=1 Tax=Ruminococcus sp. TaxID=41978 RepID=UPI003AB7F791
MLLKLAAGCVVIMTFIVIACLITPKIARFIEKRHPELAEKDDPERVDGENTGNDPENYKVQGIFDKSHIDGWDPNYKIYNATLGFPNVLVPKTEKVVGLSKIQE